MSRPNATPRLLGLVLALTLAAPDANALPDETWVVSIGNDRGAPDDAPLLYASRDAREIVDVLRTQGGVSSARMRLLVDEDAQTVRDAIHEVNAQIRARLSEGQKQTALVLFYSGHGDAEALHLGNTRLPISELRTLAQGSAASLRLVFIDACRSGALTRVKGLQAAPEFELNLDDKVENEGLAIISSSAAGESSQETDRLRASFFTHHLVSALRGAADKDGNGQVTLGEAYSYASTHTVRSSAQTLAMQHPTYSYDVKGRAEVVLTTPGLASRRTGRLRLRSTDTYVVSEGKEGGPIVAEVTPEREKSLLALPEGRYFVQERRPRAFHEYDVALAADEVDLGSLQPRVVQYDKLVRKRGGAPTSSQGLTALGGVQGGLVSGEPPLPSVVLGWGLDFPWLTAGVRLRGATASLDSIDGGLPSQHLLGGLGFVVSHVFDLDVASLGFGAVVEGVLHRQSFVAGARTAPDRQAFGAAFGLLLSAERELVGGLSVRLEGGPSAYLLPVATIKDGAQTGTSPGSVITYWAGLGLAWRL